LARSKKKSGKIKALLVADETSAAERVELLEMLEDWQIKRGGLENEIEDLEIRAATLQGEYNILEQNY
jgi:hypothetical protein